MTNWTRSRAPSFADRGQDVLQGHVLDQEAARTRPQRGVYVIVVVVERGEHDDPGLAARILARWRTPVG